MQSLAVYFLLENKIYILKNLIMLAIWEAKKLVPYITVCIIIISRQIKDLNVKRQTKSHEENICECL